MTTTEMRRKLRRADCVVIVEDDDSVDVSTEFSLLLDIVDALRGTASEAEQMAEEEGLFEGRCEVAGGK